MIELEFINSMEDFLRYNQIIKLLQDQMEFIGSPKSNEEIMNTFKIAFTSESAKLLIAHKQGHPVGFMFFNISIGMESAGKYLWLNEIHIHSEYRGKGYGSIMFDYLKNWCNENGILRIIGMTELNDEPLKHFYTNQHCELYAQNVFSYKIK